MSIDLWGGEDGIADLVTVEIRDIFGATGTYTRHATSETFPLTAPFDDPYFEMVLLDGVPVSNAAPAYDVRLADLQGAAPAQGDTITVRSPSTWAEATFRVEDIRRGGQGTAKLMLSQVPD